MCASFASLRFSWAESSCQIRGHIQFEARSLGVGIVTVKPKWRGLGGFLEDETPKITPILKQMLTRHQPAVSSLGSAALLTHFAGATKRKP